VVDVVLIGNRGSNMLNCVDAIDEMWARSCELEIKCQSSEGYNPVTIRTQGLTKSFIYKADDNFGLLYPWYSCVLSLARVKPGMHSIVDSVFSSRCIMPLGRCIHNWLKIPSYITMHQLTQQMLLGMLSGTGVWEELQQPSYYPTFSLCDHNLIPKLDQPLHGQLEYREDILTAVWCEVA
jgi:hypothetical protein